MAITPTTALKCTPVDFDGILPCQKTEEAKIIIPAVLQTPLLLSSAVQQVKTGNQTEHVILQQEHADQVDIQLGEQAFLTHYLLNPSEVNLKVSVPRGSHYELFILQTVSGQNSITINLEGEGAEAFIYGIGDGEEDEEIDNNVLVRHLAQHTISQQQIRVLADEKAAIRFKGNIEISKNGAKSNAGQLAKGLLLSDQASIHVEPWLEIANDDVKAAHGTSVGCLDPRMVFYLQSRGMKEEQAVALLQQAFLHEITEQIPDEAMKSYFESQL